MATDKSIFQGWLESDKYRAEWRGAGVWHLYEHNGAAFVKIATVSGTKKASMQDLLNQMDQMDESDE
jgi:hypothetical protein